MKRDGERIVYTTPPFRFHTDGKMSVNMLVWESSSNTGTRIYRDTHVDQNKVPNNLLVNEPSLSTQRIGGRCGR